MSKNSETEGKMSARKPRARHGQAMHCFECDQICCRTAAVEIESPRSLRDYSDLLFYLHHRKTQIVIVPMGRRKEWYVEFLSECSNLVDGRCVQYEHRPAVCREYDMSHCERNAGHDFVYLREPEDLFEFLRGEGRTRVLEKLEATHRPAGGAGRSRTGAEPRRTS